MLRPGLLLLTHAVLTSNTFAGDCAPPPNEDCDGAIVFDSTALPFDITAPLGCVNDVIDKPYFDAFYRFDCLVSGAHLFEMCDSSGDTYLRIYVDGCGWGTGTELATADDECPGSPPNADPLIVVELEAGTQYWIEVGTWRPDPPWAPPLNSPYTLRVALPGALPSTSCDGTGISTVLVAAPGNAPDTNGLGSVDGLYRVARHEVSNREYVDFLNHIAARDDHDLFDEDMTDSDRGGIVRLGSPGGFSYAVKANFGDKPVNFVTWTAAARFCNWLHNGRPDGPQDSSTTENGAYDLSLPLADITRLPGARWFLPTHDEWYKAAYFDPVDSGADGGGTPDYWLYPTRTDSLPVQATSDSVGNVENPGSNVANYDKGADWNGENGNVTSIGGTTSTSPWGAEDMAGNIFEMTETPDVPIDANTPTRTARGGDFSNAGILMSSPDSFSVALNMQSPAGNFGFRPAARMCMGDFDGDNDIDEDDRTTFSACFTGPGGGPLDILCSVGDFDEDNDVDCSDWDAFVLAWTAPDPPAPIARCGPIPTMSEWGLLCLAGLVAAGGCGVILRRRTLAGS